MTVRELIESLQRHDPDAIVVIADANLDHSTNRFYVGDGDYIWTAEDVKHHQYATLASGDKYIELVFGA